MMDFIKKYKSTIHSLIRLLAIMLCFNLAPLAGIEVCSPAWWYLIGSVTVCVLIECFRPCSYK